MPIDVHAHFVPRRILDTLRAHGGPGYGVTLVDTGARCPCVHFEHGLRVRPFFERLLESERERIGVLDAAGIDRQVLSSWADIFGYALPADKALAWHRLLNDCLAETCARHPARFSWLASGPLPHADAAARELERSVRELGARGAIVAANVEGVNLGELDLDAFWSAVQALGVPVLVHPAQPAPLPRTARFGLNTTVQYAFDTTLTAGSLVSSGVLDRFPRLELILCHGGGAFPYLAGRFDVMHERMPRAEQGDVAAAPPSHYLRRFHYDTIVHDAQTLRFLASRVGADRLVLGSDDPFPPMDKDALASVRRAGFSAEDERRITEDNPRRLLKL